MNYLCGLAAVVGLVCLFVGTFMLAVAGEVGDLLAFADAVVVTVVGATVTVAGAMGVRD